MDIKLLLSIYNKQWLMEPSAAVQMLDVWERIRSGELKSYSEVKAEDRTKFFAKSGVTVAPTTSWEMRDFKGFNGSSVAIIPISGPLMKSDYCGEHGTASMQALTQQAIDTPSVKSIVFMVDSPGGTVDGTQAFASTIKNAGKRTICLVDGTMASAAYWIGSSCDEIYATSSTNLIGSIGTMCSFYDDEKYLENKGIVLREYYATESKDKNATFTEAKKGDGKKLISEMLDPLNDEFLSTVKANRAGKISGDETLTGKLYLAKQAQTNGLIDGIKTLNDVLQTNTKKANKMTAAEYKAAHPAEYANIVAEGVEQGVKQEQSRVRGWNAWRSVDADAVEKGIASGETVDQNIISEFSAKAANKARGNALTEDNAEDIKTAAPEAPKTDDELSLEANTAALMEHIKGGKRN